MKQVCKWAISVMSLMVMFSLAVPLTVSAEMVKKVDNFIVFLDRSGSMVESSDVAGQQKIKLAIDTITRLDKAIPELDYTSTVALFAPFKVKSDTARYKAGTLGAAVADVTLPFSHLTPMGDAIKDIAPVVGKLSGKTAVIFFTDGESNEGVSPIQEAKALYAKYAPNLCFHVVSYSNTPTGQRVVDELKALSGCTVVAKGADLVDDAALAKFAQEVLYDVKQPAPVAKAAPAPVPAPAPAPAPVAVAKEVITFNLLFGFDKWAITDEMIPVLEQAKAILNEDPSVDFILSGHTDWTGTEAYNQGLSERRAASVKKWLVDNGVAPSRLTTIGYGETRAKYDNKTREGRKLNRRVELMSK